MVSRKDTDPPRYQPTNAGIIDQMLRLLSALILGVSHASSRAVRSIRFFAHQAPPTLAGDLLGTVSGRRVALWMGVSAVFVGATLRFAAGTSDSALDWVLTVLVALAWSGARLVVMRLANEGLDAAARRDVSSAWSAGLLPYAAGVTPLLYALTWIGSLLLTGYYLEKLTITGVDARRTMAWVAGFEIAAAAAVWISGNLAVLIPID